MKTFLWPVFFLSHYIFSTSVYAEADAFKLEQYQTNAPVYGLDEF
jgi:hypothetical protein